MHPYPGSPSEKGSCERFYESLRGYVLNAACLATARQAQIANNQWRRQYNQVRLHQVFSMEAPAPETVQRTASYMAQLKRALQADIPTAASMHVANVSKVHKAFNWSDVIGEAAATLARWQIVQCLVLPAKIL